MPDNIEVTLDPEKLKIVGSLTNQDNHLLSSISNEIISKTTENQWINPNILSDYLEHFQFLNF